MVMPGEHAEARWSGSLDEGVSPPTECFEQGPCGLTCPRLRIPTTEEITANVSAITRADCIAAEPDPSVCDCAAPGRCEGYGRGAPAPTLLATATFSPAAGPIVLEIEG